MIKILLLSFYLALRTINKNVVEVQVFFPNYTFDNQAHIKNSQLSCHNSYTDIICLANACNARSHEPKGVDFWLNNKKFVLTSEN